MNLSAASPSSFIETLDATSTSMALGYKQLLCYNTHSSKKLLLLTCYKDHFNE